MKYKFYQFLFSACFVFALTLTTTVKAQDTIFYNNFDSSSVVPPALPIGWTTTVISGDTGWISSSSNSSTGYSYSSGLNCLDISNSVVSGGTFTLTSPSISTLGFNNITVIYGARRTTHFSDNGSTITSFDFSTDGGSSWTNIPYAENTGDSNWHLINDSTPLTLPSSANNKASIIFRWVATLAATSSGTYRIDDFNVGGSLINGINEYKNQDVFKVFVDNDKLLHLNAKLSFQLPASSYITVSDVTGRICLNEKITSNTSIISLSDFRTGIYYVKVVAGGLSFVQKVICY